MKKYIIAVALTLVALSVAFNANYTIRMKEAEAEAAYAESVDDSFGEYWYGFDGGHVSYYRLNNGRYRVDVYTVDEKSGVDELESTVLVDDVDTAHDIVDMILENN